MSPSKGPFALKTRELAWTLSFIISNSARQPSKLSRVFLLSASATFTRVLPTTSHIARKLRHIWSSRKQRQMLFKNNWRLIMTIKSRLQSYAHAFWAGGPRLKRAAMQRRRHRLHSHASAAHRSRSRSRHPSWPSTSRSDPGCHNCPSFYSTVGRTEHTCRWMSNKVAKIVHSGLIQLLAALVDAFAPMLAARSNWQF
jgi:hypothetical protein